MGRPWSLGVGLLIAGLTAMHGGPGFAGALTPEDVAGALSVQDSASARLEVAGQTIYFDPLFDGTTAAPPADLILITHGHDRHCSTATIARILKPETAIVAPEGCAHTLADVARRHIITPVPGGTVVAAGLPVEAVAAYTPDHPDHARETGGVGYVLTVGGVRVYHSGSTALVPELKDVRADVALIAFWEGYILSTQDAAALARSLGTKVVVPIHCRPEEAVKLRDTLEPGIPVLIKGQPQT